MITRRSLNLFLITLPLLPVRGPQSKTADWASALIAAARAQIGITTDYDPAYVRLAYPGGDVPREKGVCTDVIIRAYRDAFDLDLQKLVHDDMSAAFSAYPDNWGLSRPDRHIDHRRVPNLERFFERQSAGLDVPNKVSGWQPGDLCTMRLGGNLPHIGIVSDRQSRDGSPLVIHNIGQGTREEKVLGLYDRERRFRFAPPADG